PLQKAGIVMLIRKRTDDLTLAIGDGANDVSMIQKADVGVGISGQEGRQAVMSSDFAMAQFRFLVPLLLVHGHWNYQRMAYMLLYNFYRNAIFVLVLFWYALFTAFTLSTAINEWSSVLYSVIYTAVPTIVVGILDKDLDKTSLLRYPQLYASGQKQESYNGLLFWLTVADTLWQSMVAFFVPLIAYWKTDVDGSSIGDLWTLAVVFLVNLHLAMDVVTWNWIIHASIWGSIVATIICVIIIDAIPILPGYWAIFNLASDSRFWFCLIGIIVASLLPRYGTVVDVFIPNRKSRSGKRFAFVRFIKVGNVDRLVENLCTIWIGRMHLHANVVRYDRPPISSSRPNVAPRPTVKSVSRPSANGASSFVSVLKGNPNTINHISTSPAMVLDDECLVERDLDNFVLGEVKDFSSINNLLILLSNEGFQHVRLVYLGGLWVMIELPSIETKTRFMKHVGVASWFSQLRTAQSDFVSRERIVWIDIEGVPLHAWSRPTFSKIGSRWGEVLELEDNKDDCFARKRICIKTKQEDNILEKFKIIVRGKIFVVRAKELFVWSPSFKGVNDAEFVSDDDSVNGEEEKNDDMSKKVNLEDESDIEGVSETVFGDQDDPLVQELNQNSLPNEKEISSDPFNLYNLINKRDKGEENTGLDSSLHFPPGFIPADQVKSDRKNSPLHSHSGGLNSRVLEESQPTKDQGSQKDNLNQRVGGSILEVIDDMIKVGQAMGFMMEGSKKDMEKIIGSQGVCDGFK
ncbi:RNA-directed DNA polymerase, eukaryota, partial [Tanacetum coccineum]